MTAQETRNLIKKIEAMMADGKTSYEDILHSALHRLRVSVRSNVAAAARKRRLPTYIIEMHKTYLRAAEAVTGVSADVIMSHGRERTACTARAATIVAMYEASDEISTVVAGALFNRDHSTVNHCRQRVKESKHLRELADDIRSAAESPLPRVSPKTEDALFLHKNNYPYDEVARRVGLKPRSVERAVQRYAEKESA